MIMKTITIYVTLNHEIPITMATAVTAKYEKYDWYPGFLETFPIHVSKCVYYANVYNCTRVPLNFDLVISPKPVLHSIRNFDQ